MHSQQKLLNILTFVSDLLTCDRLRVDGIIVQSSINACMVRTDDTLQLTLLGVSGKAP